MRVIERLAVSRDVSLMIVEIGQKVLAVSATKEGLRLLCELSPRDVEALNADRPAPPSNGTDDNSTFFKRFLHNMRIQLRLLPKDTPPARPAMQEDTPPPPSQFAMALLRAQAEDDKSTLIELLDKKPKQETRTDAEPIFPDIETKESSGFGGARDYNAAIESLKQMGKIETPVVPVAPTAAAAAYKTMPAPVPKPETRQRREQPAEAEFIREEKPIARAESFTREEKQPSRDDRVDELFDRISKRNSRYTKK